MALPTSTIVMALITAVPFGFAIKDTINGTSSVDLRSDDAREADDATESMDRAQREFEEREEKRKVQLRTAIEKLIPMTTKAVLGVTGYELNREVPYGWPAELDPLVDLAHAVITPAQVDGTLKSLTISLPQYRSEESVCLLVSERLDVAWGDSARTYANDKSRKHYATTTPHQRVTFIDPDGSERCELVLEQFIAVPDFANKTESSTIPLWAVGKPAAKLVEKLGDDAFSDASQIRWTRLGVGEGLGETELHARIVKGKIVTITAKFQASETTIRALGEKLVADFGEPAESDPLMWTRPKLALATLDDTAGEYLLTAGEPLPVEE